MFKKQKAKHIESRKPIEKPKVIEMKKEKEIVEEVKEVPVVLTPQELWAAAVTERKTTPQWECKTDEVPVYDYHISVQFNEEDKSKDDNIFQLAEPLSISVGVSDNTGNKHAPVVMIPGVEIKLLPPGIAPYEKVTDADGKVRFNPAFLGQWQFIVTDVGIAPKFVVTK
jgi:hypothetical protein